MGFEPTRAEHIGLAVQRLNLSATSSAWCSWKNVLATGVIIIQGWLISSKIELYSSIVTANIYILTIFDNLQNIKNNLIISRYITH